jgi:hypothetical protein
LLTLSKELKYKEKLNTTNQNKDCLSWCQSTSRILYY